MAKYRVHFRAWASTQIDVEASSEDEAIALAYDKTPGLCAKCSGWGQDAGIDLGEWTTTDEYMPEMKGEQAVEVIE